MSDSRVPVLCPLCGALMRVPRRGRQATITCHNGHVFLHTFEHQSRWLSTPQFVAVEALLLLLFALVFAHQWNGRHIGSTTSAVAGDQVPRR